MINDIFTIWLREVIRFWRAKSRVIGSLAMPFFWLAIMGSGFSSIVPNVGGTNYLTFMMPGIIGMTLLFSSMFSGLSVLVDKQFGFMKEIMVAPISRLSIMLGKTLGGSTSSMMNGIIMLILGLAIGIKIISFFGILFSLAFMLLITMSFVSLGVAISSRMTDTSGFHMIMNFLIMPMFLLSGALFPIENTPVWMQSIAHIDPLFYGVDGLRGSLIGISTYPIFVDFSVLLAFCTAMIFLGTYLFEKSEA
ncbi:MAG: ABC transporter permease [Candidatus Aenigmatarchaeota archaeon]